MKWTRQRCHVAESTCRLLQAFVAVADHELDAAQTPPRQRAQEGRPERLGLGWPDLEAEHLATPVRRCVSRQVRPPRSSDCLVCVKHSTQIVGCINFGRAQMRGL